MNASVSGCRLRHCFPFGVFGRLTSGPAPLPFAYVLFRWNASSASQCFRSRGGIAGPTTLPNPDRPTRASIMTLKVSAPGSHATSAQPLSPPNGPRTFESCRFGSLTW